MWCFSKPYLPINIAHTSNSSSQHVMYYLVEFDLKSCYVRQTLTFLCFLSSYQWFVAGNTHDMATSIARAWSAKIISYLREKYTHKSSIIILLINIALLISYQSILFLVVSLIIHTNSLKTHLKLSMVSSLRRTPNTMLSKCCSYWQRFECHFTLMVM